MKKTAIILTVLFWATLLVAQKITVTKPNSNTVWEKGVTNSITWSATGTSGVYKVTYQEKDKNPIVIAENLVSNNLFFITPEKPSYESKIMVVDQNNPAINDESDPFFNASYKSLMIKPLDNDHSFSAGYVYPVQWRDNATGFKYFVRLLKDGASESTLLAGELSDTTYNWVMPAVPGNYRLIVGMVGFPLTNDTSNVVTVQGIPNNITIIHPSGQTLYYPKLTSVEFAYQLKEAVYTVYYKKVSDTNWDSIKSEQGNSDLYSIITSYPPRNDDVPYHVKVSDQFGNFAISKPFLFTESSIVELNSPNNYVGINQIGVTKIKGNLFPYNIEREYTLKFYKKNGGGKIKELSGAFSQGFEGTVTFLPGEITEDTVLVWIEAVGQIWAEKIKVNNSPMFSFTPNFNGRAFTKGITYEINWFSNFTPSQGVILYAKSEYNDSVFIANVSSGNSYNWLVPEEFSGNWVTLFVMDKSNPSIKAASSQWSIGNSNFFMESNIMQPGGEARFSWLTNPGSNYSIYIRPDKESPWDTLLANATYKNRTANLIWNIPNYQLRYDLSGTSLGELVFEEKGNKNYSNSYQLTFKNKNNITVLYPTTFDSVKANTRFSFQYSMSEPLGSVSGTIKSHNGLTYSTSELHFTAYSKNGSITTENYFPEGSALLSLNDDYGGRKSFTGIYNTDKIKPVLLRPGVPGQVIYNDHLRVQWGYYNRHALIELSSDGGATWQKLAERNFDNRDTVFTVNERVISDNCLIRLTCEEKTVVSEPFKLRSINPFITEVKDVKNDDGGRVILKWKGFKNDTPNNALHQTGYSIWRALDANYLKPQSPAIAWEYVATVPAAGFEEYAYTTPTILDSTKSGVALHHFMVSYTEGFTGTVYYSNTISGYSVDNIIPVKPENVKASGFESSVALKWNANSEKDIKFYEVYRSTVPGGTDTAKTVYAVTSDTLYIDANPLKQTMYYRLAAVDKHDNRSEKSNEVAFTPVGVEAGDMVYNYELYANYPNPFNPSTTISFSLKNPGYTKIQIYDMLGNHIRTIAEGDYAAGKHSMVFDATGLASGMYYYSVTSGEFNATKKMVLVK